MRALIVMMMAGFLLAGPAYGQNLLTQEKASAAAAAVQANDDARMVIAQDTTAAPKKKIQLWRVCSAEQIRCACADTGTSACCTAQQACNCQPTANCR